MAQRIKNVVLVHGAFADGSGWEPVAHILKNDGYKVSVVQHPETSYADDQKYTKAAIEAMAGLWFWWATAMVGRSSPRPAIIQTLRRLSILPHLRWTLGKAAPRLRQAVPQASTAFKPDSNGNWWIEQEHFAADFAADIPKDQAEYMAVSQVPISTDAFTHKVTNPAWKTKPTWYMVATEDRSINPEQERMMAKRARAKTVEVNSSHVAYMSHPRETAKLIEEAAASVAGPALAKKLFGPREACQVRDAAHQEGSVENQIVIKSPDGAFHAYIRSQPRYPRRRWSFCRNCLALMPISARPATSWQPRGSSRSRRTCSGGKSPASISA